MKLSIFAIGTATLVGSVFAGAPSGYGESLMSWNFKNPKGGEDLVYEGTVQEATAQFQKEHPNVEPARAQNQRRQSGEQGWEGAAYDCIDASHPNQGWKPAKYDKINDGWNHLWNLEGAPSAGPGAGECSRVSCSYDAAIWWCNDNPEPITLDSWGVLAKGALEVCNACSALGLRNRCGGQMFHTDGFNVIVREDSC